MQHAVTNTNTTPRNVPLIQKNLDLTQTQLQRQIDQLNNKVSKGTDQEKIMARIAIINKDIQQVRIDHDKEREDLKTWGMTPKTWKYIGSGATIFTVIADIASIASNISLQVLTENTTEAIIITTSITSGVGILAAGIFGMFTFGQYKVEKRLDIFDQRVRQNELISIFLNSYQEFMSNQPERNASKENLRDQVSELKACVENLKNISSFSVPQEAKDHWLSSMIQNLPDTADLKKKLTELKDLAVQIESKKMNIQDSNSQDTSSDEPNFLKTTRADQAADLGLNRPETDPLREKFDANLKALREEFNMDIQEIQVNGYRIKSDANIKKIKEKHKDSVVIDLNII
jgi:hypothetical protein